MISEAGKNLAGGLTSEEAAARLVTEGPNEIASAPPASPLMLLLRQFKDLMVLILLLACGVSFAAWLIEGHHGLPADSIVIGAIVILNAALGFTQEYRAEKTVEELKKLVSTSTRVVRDGRTVSVDRAQVVPGDLVLLDEGDRVPADLVLVQADELMVDESLLTGESTTVAKHVGDATEGPPPIDGRVGEVFAGTTVTAGAARGIVSATGSRTQLGAIAASLSSTTSAETPLQTRLDRLSRQIGWVVLILSVLIGGCLLLVEGRLDAPTLLRVLMFSVALAVAAVPEGLPAVLTISLSVGARRLAAANAVVRRMPAVETLGSVTAIVTDKTGTLTHNQMTVVRIFVDGVEQMVSGSGYEATGRIEGSPGAMLIRAGVLASTADLVKLEGKARQALGDPTEAALLVLAEKAGLDWRSERAASRAVSWAPFSSARRRMSVLIEVDGQRQLFVKGSLDTLMARADKVSMNGVEIPLTPQYREMWMEEENRMAASGLRALALAARTGVGNDAEPLEHSLTLLGLVAMADPARDEVPAAVRNCHRAGIRVIMLTGDHPRTALAIATEIGLTKDQTVLSGMEVDAMDDSALDQRLRDCNVFARVSPHAKLRIVDRLLESGEVLAMTGDGVNDAPALKKVHVGVAMGSGTAVAIEASELVLLDDNFATIVKAVEGGRSVFANVQKFIAFLFSGNCGVVLAMFLGTLLAGFFDLRHNGHILLPLTAAQILWMNLVTDGAPAIAFALARSRAIVLEDPPRHPDDPILPASLWRFIIVTGVSVSVVLLVVLDVTYQGGILTLPGAETNSPILARTAAFYAVVATRLFNALNFQALPGSLLRREAWRDYYVSGACLVSWLLTLMVLYVPSLRALFDLAWLPPRDLLVLTVVAPTVVIVGELWKAFFGVRLSGR